MNSKIRKFAAVTLLAFSALGANAQNLIVNPSNELPLVGGEIPGWTEFIGGNWTQRSSDPAPFDGSYYFFAGDGADATLRQTVSLAPFAAQLAAKQIGFLFTGYIRSFDQSPPDSATINVRLLDGGGTPLVTYTTGALTSTANWQRVAINIPFNFSFISAARNVQIDLVSTRNNGSNNDGYFDALSLVAVPVPEPTTGALFALGVCALGLVRSRRLIKRS
jgi:PEP-CTERM motif